MALNINHTTDKLTPTTGTMDVVGALTVNGIPMQQAVVLASDASSTSTTLANITGFTFTAVANKTYIVELMGIAKQDSNNGSPLFALDVPDGTITGFNTYGGNTSTDAIWQDQNADASFVTVQANGLRTNAVNYPLFGVWVYNAGGTGGTVNMQIRIRSSGTGTLVAGSVMQWRQVN